MLLALKPQEGCWTKESKEYLTHGTLPEEEDDAERVGRQAMAYCIQNDDDEASARQEKGDLPVIPTKSRSALVSQDAAPASTPPGAASGPSAAPSSAPGARAPAPQASRLLGFKLGKRRVDYAAVDQPPPAAKKRKVDEATPPGAEPSAAAAPPSVKKGSDDTRISPAWSSSRGLEEHPRGESAPVAPLALEALVSSPAAGVPKAREPPVSQALVTTSSPPPPAPLIPGPSASPDVLERALLHMTRLREGLQGPDCHLAAGHLELVSGYLEESHGTSTSNGQDGEDTKCEGQEEEPSRKLQAPDDRPSPDVRPLEVTTAQRTQAYKRYSGRTTEQDRMSDDPQAPDDQHYDNRTESTEIQERPGD
nr:proline-rich protein 36-like [Aegilops tauschii subsp. strangulata]